MKKLALLTVLALVISISCVFATDLNVTATDPVVTSVETPETATTGSSGEVELITDLTSGEDLVLETSGEINEISGEISGENDKTTDAPTQDTTSTQTPETNEETVSNTSDNSAMIGAILAIVIVIAVVAIAAILRKD